MKSKEICGKCNKELDISKLNICQKCGKILCRDCQTILSRTSAEVNHDYHYLCFDKSKKGDKPGEFAKMYIDPLSITRP